MKIKSIEIVDTLGTTHARFNPGTVTRIRGANGSGKSSILKSLCYLFSGGTDPSVIRKGADASTIKMLLTDGTVITKVTRPKRARKGGEITGYTTDLVVTQPDGTPRNAPQTYINELSDALAVDPSILLRIDPTTVPGRKALAAELMRLVPLSFEPDEVNRACSYRSSLDIPNGQADTIALSESPERPLTLDEFKKTIAQITEQRRRIGQTKDDSDGAINRLRTALPEDDGADYAVTLSALEQEQLDIERAIADRRVEIEQQKSEVIAAAREEMTANVSAMREEIDTKIRELEAERARRQNALRDEFDRLSVNAAEVEKGLLKDLEQEARPEKERVAAEIGQCKEKMAAHERAHTLRQEIESQLKIHRQAAWTYDRLSDVLQNLEKLRMEKLSNLPVAGLVVEEGEVYLDGIPWQNVNLARRVEAVLQICAQRAGKLSLLLIDDSEHLDRETRDAIEHGLVEAGFQVIEAIVEDGPLRIEQAAIAAA